MQAWDGRRQNTLSTPRAAEEFFAMPSRTDVETALRRLAPRIPPHEFMAVADHAMDSPGLRHASPEAAAWLSLVAYVRHVLTDYELLLEQGYDTESARHFVAGEMDDILKAWGSRRLIQEGDG
jgi:hypothetical protein